MLSFRKKTQEPIARKLPERRTDSPYSKDTSVHSQRSNKRISQLKGVVVDSKNKTQYNSAYPINLEILLSYKKPTSKTRLLYY